MKYSFIVPVYNVEKYLSKCIDSILEQAITDFECILVDDGSPDECPRICDEYAKKDSRIKVIHKENGGLSSARNAGLDIAKGDYICFVDSDDYITEDYLSVIDAKLSATDADMLCFGAHTVDELGNVKSNCLCNEGEYILSDEMSRFHFICNTLLTYKVRWAAWDRVFKHSVIRENNLRFYNNKEIYAEDLHFAILYSLHCKNVVAISDCLYFYLLRTDSITGANALPKLDEFVNLNYVLFSYLQSLGYKLFEKKFYTLFYLIMDNRYRQSTYMDHLIYIPKIRYKSFFRRWTFEVLIHQRQIGRITGHRFFMLERMLYISYLCSSVNKYLGFFVRYCGIVTRGAFRVIKKILQFFKNIPDKLWRKNIYLFGTEDFGNMGDHLIASSEIDFLKDNYPEYRINELPASKYFEEIDSFARKIKRSDLIFLTGGGNMGDMYPFASKIRMDTISRFPNNRICIFPQTVFFDDMNNAETAKEKYRKAKILTIASRENRSFGINKAIFDNAKHILVPDIVFYNDLQTDDEREDVIRLCLRNDMERTMNDEDLIELKKLLKDFKVDSFDMQLSHDVSVSRRDEYLAKMLKNYTTARLIITDRLHGMIVSTVTGTPCIVLNSKSHKLRESYEWIKDLKYVKFANSVDEVPLLVDELLSLSPEDCRYSNERFKEYYQQIVESMK